MVNPCGMTWITAPIALLAVGICVGWLAPLSADARQESRTEALAQEVTSLLTAQKRDYIAARLAEDEFVAALFQPGTELLVVRAKYAAPALLFEKIVSRNYKEAYLDLYTASVPDSRIMIEDMKSDGLHVARGNRNDPFDIVTSGTQAAVQFDGEYKKRKMSEEAYLKAFSEADAAYERMLTALVAELKK
jgi:hypothetical protein